MNEVKVMSDGALFLQMTLRIFLDETIAFGLQSKLYDANSASVGDVDVTGTWKIPQDRLWYKDGELYAQYVVNLPILPPQNGMFVVVYQSPSGFTQYTTELFNGNMRLFRSDGLFYFDDSWTSV